MRERCRMSQVLAKQRQGKCGPGMLIGLGFVGALREHPGGEAPNTGLGARGRAMAQYLFRLFGDALLHLDAVDDDYEPSANPAPLDRSRDTDIHPREEVTLAGRQQGDGRGAEGWGGSRVGGGVEGGGEGYVG